VVVHDCLPHVNIRLPTRFLIGVADGADVALHLVKSGMHFLEAFLKEEAFPCGYCTPGMIMSAVALLNSAPNHSEQDIIRRMNGNICRCGTYGRIIAAIQKAASGKKAEAHG